MQQVVFVTKSTFTGVLICLMSCITFLPRCLFDLSTTFPEPEYVEGKRLWVRLSFPQINSKLKVRKINVTQKSLNK